MTDVPQLEALLVDAARRHRRARRVRRSAFRVFVPVAVVALAFVIVPWIGREARERELPAKTPTPAPTIAANPTTIKSAYGVFRRAPRAADELPNAKRGDVIRRIAATRSANVFLVQRGSQLCLVTTDDRRRIAGTSCGPAASYLDGHRLIGTFSDEKGPSPIAFAFPDGVRSVRLTLENGDVGTYPVTTNGFARDLPARPVKLEWTAPDGSAQSSEFHAAPTPRAQDFYSVLKRPAKPGDAVNGLPARTLVTLDDAHATASLVPRQGAVCLVLHAKYAHVSGCRHNVADVRYPLVVAVPRQRGEPERIVAVVFPDAAKNIRVIPPVRSARSQNALLLAQGETATTLRWQTSSTDPPRTETLPSGNGGFVLHAREESPSSIPAETG